MYALINLDFIDLERRARIELATLAWKAKVIPFYDTRMCLEVRVGVKPTCIRFAIGSIVALPPDHINTFMKYIEYLDLPTIPEYLIESTQDIISKPPKAYSSVASDYAYFKTKHVSNDLKSWLESMFGFEIYQIGRAHV